ncbi:MAG TPA: hypothetical protein VG652_00290 [Gaiellaceae bacterium]|nr:hypothetical protein [Gaiellaceae bacterium]
MSFFLLTYTRGSHREPDIAEFQDPAAAMERFVAAERSHREHDDGRGVVLLIAEDEETLRRTHSHYFESLEETLAGLRS